MGNVTVSNWHISKRNLVSRERWLLVRVHPPSSRKLEYHNANNTLAYPRKFMGLL
jgi:hypothetical protein